MLQTGRASWPTAILTMKQSRLFPWRLGTTATLLLGLATLCGCSVINAYEDPLIVGDWKRDLPSGDSDDEMSIEVDGKGDGTLFFTVSGSTDVIEGEFDIDWKHRKPDQFTLDWECSNSACVGLDFTLRCDINTKGDELECEDRSDVWLTPEFDWKDD
jgi:hypothetical protein